MLIGQLAHGLRMTSNMNGCSNSTARGGVIRYAYNRFRIEPWLPLSQLAYAYRCAPGLSHTKLYIKQWTAYPIDNVVLDWLDRV